MSTEYKTGDTIPSQILCKRLHELADAVTKGPDTVRREFTMRIPAELDYDADLVLSLSAQRIDQLERQLAEKEAEIARIKAMRYLPKITEEILEAFGGDYDHDTQLIEWVGNEAIYNHEPQWTQTAVDFACMFNEQSTTTKVK